MVDASIINKIQRQVKHRENILAADLAAGGLISLRFKMHLQITKKKKHPQVKDG